MATPCGECRGSLDEPYMEQLRGTPPGTPGEAGGGVECSLQAETPVLLGQPQDALGQVISHWLVHCEEDLRVAKLVKSALKSKRKRALRKGEELPPAFDQDLEDYRERAAKLATFQKLATEKLAVLHKWPKGRPFPPQFVSKQGSRAPPLTLCPRQDVLRLPATGLGNRWQLLRRAHSFLCADHDVSTDGRRDGAPDFQYWQPWASKDSLGHQEMRAGSAIETPGQDQGAGISPRAGRHGVVPSPDESASLTGPGIERLMKEVQEPATKGAAGGINWTCMGTTTGVTIKKHDHLDVEVSEDMEDGEVADDLVPEVLEEDEGSEAEQGEEVELEIDDVVVGTSEDEGEVAVQEEAATVEDNSSEPSSSTGARHGRPAAQAFAGAAMGYEVEAGEDGVVPSTPKLPLARRTDGFAEAVSSPQVMVDCSRLSFTEKGVPSFVGHPVTLS